MVPGDGIRVEFTRAAGGALEAAAATPAKGMALTELDWSADR